MSTIQNTKNEKMVQLSLSFEILYPMDILMNAFFCKRSKVSFLRIKTIQVSQTYLFYCKEVKI